MYKAFVVYYCEYHRMGKFEVYSTLIDGTCCYYQVHVLPGT